MDDPDATRHSIDAGRHINRPCRPDTKGAGWPSALVTVALAWLVLGTIFFGFLPAPIIGLAMLGAARMIMRGT